jgi:hypothetical protein
MESLDLEPMTGFALSSAGPPLLQRSLTADSEESAMLAAYCRFAAHGSKHSIELYNKQAIVSFFQYSDS